MRHTQTRTLAVTAEAPPEEVPAPACVGRRRDLVRTLHLKAAALSALALGFAALCLATPPAGSLPLLALAAAVGRRAVARLQKAHRLARARLPGA